MPVVIAVVLKKIILYDSRNWLNLFSKGKLGFKCKTYIASLEITYRTMNYFKDSNSRVLSHCSEKEKIKINEHSLPMRSG